jgi:hypothetical protein
MAVPTRMSELNRVAGHRLGGKDTRCRGEEEGMGKKMKRWMTDGEWRTSTSSEEMLDCLQSTGRVSHRKLRLCAVAICRRIRHLLPDASALRAADLAEQNAEGMADTGELRAAYDALSEKVSAATYTIDAPPSYWAMKCVLACLEPLPFPRGALSNAAFAVAAQTERATLPSFWDSLMGESHCQKKIAQASWASHMGEYHWCCGLLRDVFGNPFHPYGPVQLVPAWLAWRDGTVPRMAQAIYDERTFDRMPILADALEEAGCDDQPLLSHCRGAGPHVRGCWVLDLILGKN